MRRVCGLMLVAAVVAAVSGQAQAGDCCQPQPTCCAPAKKSCLSMPKLSLPKLSLPKLDLCGLFKKNDCCQPAPCCNSGAAAPAGSPSMVPAPAAPAKEKAPAAPPYEEKAPAPKAAAKSA